MKVFSGVSVTGATPSLRRSIHYLMHTVLALERVPHDVQLRIHFVSLQHMHHLNRTYKGVDRPTDVLTFSPAGAADSFVNNLLFGDAEQLSVENLHVHLQREHDNTAEQLASLSSALFAVGGCGGLSHATVRSELVELGDIFVSLDYMQRRCAASPSRCLPLAPYLHAAMVHATLHALGYDHTTSRELQQMVRREQQLGRRIAALSRRCPGCLPPLDIWDSTQ